MIHRVHPNMQLAIFDSLDELWDPPPGYWDGHLADLDRHTIIWPCDGSPASAQVPRRSASVTRCMLFYHEREADGHYTTKVALLDHETGRVRSILPEAIMRPELPWEREGDVDAVVFVQGAVTRADGSINLTYGVADRCVGAGTVDGAGIVAAPGSSLKQEATGGPRSAARNGSRDPPSQYEVRPLVDGGGVGDRTCASRFGPMALSD